MSKYAVLIVAYRRPREFINLIESLKNSDKKIYAYIDFDENLSFENQEVIRIGRNFQNKGVIVCEVNSENRGVGLAVPSAIDWALKTEEQILVLEDDCELGKHALSYFSECADFISGNVVMVSGRSAWPENYQTSRNELLTLTNLPLTNGFLISRQSWKLMSKSFVHPKLGSRYIVSIFKNPSNLLIMSFVYSACIFNAKTSLKAWDCFIAFEMLVSNYYSVNPNFSTISTRGLDHVASNTKTENFNHIDYVALASDNKPSFYLDKSANSTSSTNYEIIKNIYGVRIQNLFSPTKSWFKIFKYKFLKVSPMF